MTDFITVSSISAMHRLLGLEKPLHPSISLAYSKDITWSEELFQKNYIWDFYIISLKYHANTLFYGRNYYDFEEGTLLFVKPGQVLSMPGTKTDEINETDDGWVLFIHPDLMRRSALSTKMEDYTFFSYGINEGLHLSQKELLKVNTIVSDIEFEYGQNIDQHSSTLILSNIELLLNHCTRFYDRQFYTRSSHQQGILVQVEGFLKAYFKSQRPIENGIPTVQQCAEHVNLSPNYLTDLLRKETGRSTQDHIHYHIIERAKSVLLSTKLPVSEVAYRLGFEYPQYFGNLFKKKTGMSPGEFRSLN